MPDTAGKRGSGAARTSKNKGRETQSKDPSPHEESSADRAAPVCSVGFCPICLAVTAMQPLRPDVIEHLLVAGREFLLAARALVDARAESFGADEPPTTGRKGSRLEKIDIG